MVAENDRNLMVNKLKNAVLEADYDATPEITKHALDMGVVPEDLMKNALSLGIQELEKKLFGDHKVWVHPIFLMAMEGVRRSLEVLEPWFKPNEDTLGKVVLGTPAGDTHDLGGKMVALALTAAGFEVSYLGRDVPLSLFIQKVQEIEADILAISSYQTSGFKKIEGILDLLYEAGLRDKVNVMLGGSVVTDKFAEKLDVGYGKHASDAVTLAQRYIGR